MNQWMVAMAAGVGGALFLLMGGGLAGCGPYGRRPVSTELAIGVSTNPMMFCQAAWGQSDMVSTYDRSGGNADWWDVPAPLPGTTDLYEALRVEGPGCIKRIWMTNVPAKEWLFFLDGEAQPRLRLSPEELFAFAAASPERPLRGNISGGAYSYVPIPFARSIRVVVRMPGYKEGRPYFQINYERYPAGANVQSWPVRMDEDTTNAFRRANASWRQVAADDAGIVRRLNWRRL